MLSGITAEIGFAGGITDPMNGTGGRCSAFETTMREGISDVLTSH